MDKDKKEGEDHPCTDQHIDDLLNGVEKKFGMIGRDVPDIDHSQGLDADKLRVALYMLRCLNVVHAKRGHQRVHIVIDIMNGGVSQIEFHGEDVDGKKRRYDSGP